MAKPIQDRQYLISLMKFIFLKVCRTVFVCFGSRISSEQTLQHCKALHFRDFERAQKLLNESDCNTQKEN